MELSLSVAREYMDAWPSNFERLDKLRAAAFVEDWPQSGERIRGSANYRAIHEDFPGGMPAHRMDHLAGSPEQSDARPGSWILSPSFTLVHLSGGPGGTYTAEGLLEYPNGQRFNVVVVLQIEDGKVNSQRTYFAEQFEAPEWRSRWVEHSERS